MSAHANQQEVLIYGGSFDTTPKKIISIYMACAKYIGTMYIGQQRWVSQS